MKAFFARIMPAEVVTDCHGRPVPGIPPPHGDAGLVFIDPTPGATWAHECFYIFVPPYAEAVKVSHMWPPSDGIRLREL